MSFAGALAVGAILVVTSFLLNVSPSRWRSKTRLLLVAFVLLAVAVTMTAATTLVVDPSPLQIWVLDPTLLSLY